MNTNKHRDDGDSEEKPSLAYTWTDDDMKNHGMPGAAVAMAIAIVVLVGAALIVGTLAIVWMLD